MSSEHFIRIRKFWDRPPEPYFPASDTPTSQDPVILPGTVSRRVQEGGAVAVRSYQYLFASKGPAVRREMPNPATDKVEIPDPEGLDVTGWYVPLGNTGGPPALSVFPCLASSTELSCLTDSDAWSKSTAAGDAEISVPKQLGPSWVCGGASGRGYIEIALASTVFDRFEPIIPPAFTGSFKPKEGEKNVIWAARNQSAWTLAVYKVVEQTTSLHLPDHKPKIPWWEWIQIEAPLAVVHNASSGDLKKALKVIEKKQDILARTRTLVAEAIDRTES